MSNVALLRPVVAVPDAPASPPAVPETVLVDVVVLTADLELFQAARDAVGERNPVWRARSADEAADLLITGRCGVLLLDMSSVSARADTLIQQIIEQFPEVVVCVAGTRDDEPLLGPLISDGLVFRFMHKPASARRAGMFLQAAIRRHAENRAGGGTGDPLLPVLRRLARPRPALPRRYFVLLGAISLALTLALFVGGAPRRDIVPAVGASDPGTPVAAPTAPPPPAVHETMRRADPVLARARAALQAGRLESPPGRNALDLFEAVLLAQPDNAEAHDGLARTLAQLLAQAKSELKNGRRPEAEHIVQRVLTVEPHDARALALARQINPPDTPSRQLEREQVAAVRAEAEAQAAEVARGSTPATAISLQQTSVLPSRGSLERPAVASMRAATPYPDPLTPRSTNAVPATVTRAARRATRSYGAPIDNQLPIAGLATRAPAAIAPEPEPAPPAALGPALPADAFDRITARDPVYPAQALRDRTRGWVELEFTITSTGAVRDIEIVGAEPTGVFEHAAADALAAWRFKPRTVNGQPVVQRSTITMRFDVEG
jgi:TonB family protein